MSQFKCYNYIISKRWSFKISIRQRFWFFLHLKRRWWSFRKNTLMFWHNIAYKVNTLAFHYIWQFWLTAFKNYSKFFTRKCKKQRYVYCNYNDTLMTYINSNMTLLRLKCHWMIIYNKVLDNRAGLAHHPFTYKIHCS